jgi:hypothetical protein
MQLPAKLAPFMPALVRGINNGRSPLNGPVLVQVKDATHFETKEKIAFAVDQIGGFIKVYNGVRLFLPYSALDFDGTVGNHKRGRPFASSRGRAPRRIRA